ncbi:hypothetical protein OHA25_09910 [Nonomuraea sp. NBC_00507]|uniref:hypothetical protein n=1 Tax=Nonomuraea sp. NBC_00507 TaxID=2976002 RepID=UPI002E195CC0
MGGVVMWAAMGTWPTWWDSVGLRRVALMSVLRTYRAIMAFLQRGLLALLAFSVPMQCSRTISPRSVPAGRGPW